MRKDRNSFVGNLTEYAHIRLVTGEKVTIEENDSVDATVDGITITSGLYTMWYPAIQVLFISSKQKGTK